MLNKLAFRNVRRSARDYFVYFLTMVMVTALMFSFNTLLFSKDVQDMFEMAVVMVAMIGMADFFIILIIAWLINYMVRFILEKRSREFGIYLLLGMKKKEIARLYIRENLLLGAGAFLAGTGAGILLSQILLAVFYSMIQMEYHIHLEWNRQCIQTTVLCYAGCYLLALFRCRKRFRKMNIHDLMDSQKQNEEIPESHEKGKRLLLPLSVLFFAVFGIFLFRFKDWNIQVLIFFLSGLVLNIYLLYTGISAWIFCYVRDKGNAVYRKNNLFLLRQSASKVRTMSFTMGTLTALFTLALLGSSVALMFNEYQNQTLMEKFPFDVQIYSSNADDDFQKETALLEKETAVNETFVYQIYENGTDQVNVWLYTHLKIFGSRYRKKDGTPDLEKIRQNEGAEYCDRDTYMKLSDYNHLRRMLKLPEVLISENEYAIHMKERVFRETGDFSENLNISAAGRKLSFAGYHTESFSQDGHNGGDYMIIVPDSAVLRMRPYYAELAADLEGDAPFSLQQHLDGLETDPWRINAQGHVMTEAAADTEGTDTEKIDTEKTDTEGIDAEKIDTEGIGIEEIWEEEEQGNSCTGSDTIVVYAAKNLVRDSLIPEIKYMLSSLVFPLFYVGLVFLCAALAVLCVQQLSDSVKYRFRYQVLSQIGYSRKEISGIVLKQLLFYYLCPAVTALAVSGLVAVYAGSRFNFYTGTRAMGILYFLESAGLFLGIYTVYFAVTYFGFRHNVENP